MVLTSCPQQPAPRFAEDHGCGQAELPGAACSIHTSSSAQSTMNIHQLEEYPKNV